MIHRVTASLISLSLLSAPAVAQDVNIMLPAPEVEQRLATGDFQVLDMAGTRFENDRTQRVTLMFPDSTLLGAKWANAPRGGEEFNNVPRYEVAAYQLQKLFLDPADYVVPPTVLRAFPLGWLQRMAPGVGPTFDGDHTVFTVLQYWLFNVRGSNVWEPDRFRADSVYARHFADVNLLTYLIRQSDANEGNILISTDTTNPRLFSVDNGVAFESHASNRGMQWRSLRVDRLPRSTVERLRGITPADLQTLLVLAQFRETPEGVVREDPGPPLDPNRGISRKDGVIQFGLTRREVDGVWKRLEALLERVDKGDLTVF